MDVSTATSAVLTEVNDVTQADIVGIQPDQELACPKRWIVFKSPVFDKPLYTSLPLTNEDPFTVAYCIKARDRTMFVVDEPYGVLAGNESVELRLYLKKSDDWSRPVALYEGVRHQLCIENLRIPDEIRPKTKEIGRNMARDIFKRTYYRNPMQRLYWKLNIVIQTTGNQHSKESVPSEAIHA